MKFDPKRSKLIIFTFGFLLNSLEFGIVYLIEGFGIGDEVLYYAR